MSNYIGLYINDCVSAVTQPDADISDLSGPGINRRRYKKNLHRRATYKPTRTFQRRDSSDPHGPMAGAD